MRTYLRLLAPLSILATALYLAFWASHRSDAASMPLTALDNHVQSGTTQPDRQSSIHPIKLTKN